MNPPSTETVHKDDASTPLSDWDAATLTYEEGLILIEEFYRDSSSESVEDPRKGTSEKVLEKGSGGESGGTDDKAAKEETTGDRPGVVMSVTKIMSVGDICSNFNERCKRSSELEEGLEAPGQCMWHLSLG